MQSTEFINGLGTQKQLNNSKSVHVNFALQRKDSNLTISLGECPIPQAESTKYLDPRVDDRLNWKHHVAQKAEQIRFKIQQMYWIVSRYCQLDLRSKRLIYQFIIKPIWTYVIQL